MTEVRQATRLGQRDIFAAAAYSMLPLASLIALMLGLTRIDGMLPLLVAVMVSGPVAAFIHLFIRRRFRCPQCRAHLRKSKRKSARKENLYVCADCDVAWETQPSILFRRS